MKIRLTREQRTQLAIELLKFNDGDCFIKINLETVPAEDEAIKIADDNFLNF